MSRTGFQYALAALGAVVADPEAIDIGVARSIHAGLAAAAATGRELSDLEQLALDNLMGQLTHSEGEASEPPAGEATGTLSPAGSSGGEDEEPAEPAEHEAEHPAHDEADALFGEAEHHDGA